MKNLIVIGNGMTSYKFCEKMVENSLNHEFNIKVFGEEQYPAYDRVHLTEYYTGTTAEDLLLAKRKWYTENKIELFTGEMVTSINRDEKFVETHHNNKLNYDILIFATGSSAFVPPIKGIENQGVFVYRTFEDLDAIRCFSKQSKKAAVIGGGLLGLEAAKALLDDGLETSIIEMAPRLMPRQLDDAGGALLKSKLEDLDLNILLSQSIAQIKGQGKVQGIDFADESFLDVDMVVISAGISPRDKLARKAELEVGPRGGIVVNEFMQTSDDSIYSIGECSLAHGMIWGLVAPCYEMADVAVQHIMGKSKTFEPQDLSTKLKLIGTEVASFGDAMGNEEGSKSLVVEDALKGVYKRINISADGKKLIGGILVGDASQYNILHQIAMNGMKIPEDPINLIVEGGGDSGFTMSADSLPDEATICSCENVTKGTIVEAINANELTMIGDVKSCTKAGTGCGGCLPMVDDLLTATLKNSGKEVKKVICEHFDYTRQELFEIIKMKEIKTFPKLIHEHGKGTGCELCKPLAASLFASIWNDVIAKQSNLQDTNDKFLANIQRGGTYSVVPRIPGGEITPEKLIVIGEVAKEFDLYCKITGGQRIDLFGATMNQLPVIWEKLIAAGFESGHAYGKSLRTVKSCVGSSWCRYGQQDSVSFAIEIEERYRGLRSPHKLKGGVSGCIRECAEARGKDFGLIATDKGYNIYVCGNGGANPQHALLLATDCDKETTIKYLDRFLMYYIKTAGPLTRTAKWLNELEGGIEHVKEVVVNDSLEIAAELEYDMQALVDSYQCEWKAVVESPELRKKFKHFLNDDQEDPNIQFVPFREQKMPTPWVK